MKLVRRPKSVVRRYLAALALFVLGFWVQGLHSALESHEVCEHGEPVHAAHAAQSSSERSTPFEEDHAPSASDQGEHESEHHHCGIATAVPLSELPSTPLALALGVPGAPQPSLSRGEPRADSIPRFLLAPHHSPPFFVS
jgi:hypothetical protein